VVQIVLGILRFFLASCVIVFHMSGHVPSIGVLAVNFFYVISGYLMTLVLNETYHFNARSFFSNRILRLYPAQLALCVVSLPFLWILPKASEFNPIWGTPQWQDWIGNVLIFPWAFLPEQHFRILPITWSIAVEIWCYFFLWLFVSRRPWTAAFSMVSAVLWQVYLSHAGASAASHYFPVPSALLPFSCGAASYFLISHPTLARIERDVPPRVQTVVLCAVIALFLVNWQLAVKFDSSAYYGVFYYSNTVLACAAVIALHGLTVHGKTGRFATWCGDLSYPVFLAQWVSGFVAWHLIGTDTPAHSWAVFLLGYAISLIVGIATVIVVDRPVHRVRARIRSNVRDSIPREKTA
jgi:peptidoglycan/LPS O-acetylase OafA/YrhL